MFYLYIKVLYYWELEYFKDCKTFHEKLTILKYIISKSKVYYKTSKLGLYITDLYSIKYDFIDFTKQNDTNKYCNEILCLLDDITNNLLNNWLNSKQNNVLFDKNYLKIPNYI